MITKDSIYFHEDEYCQKEIVPLQNLLSKRNDTDVTREHSEDAFTDNGFTTMSVIEETKYPLGNLKISITEFENILKEHALFYFRQVYTGYSTYQTLKPDTLAFGFENYALFYQFNSGIITKAWIVYSVFSDTLNSYPERLQSTLLKLGLVYDLVLVDWNELLTVILKNKTSVTDYVTDVL